ncbi:flagellar hook-length control protein FliK [Pseudodesulfovibrio sediminis]|uniref:Flagellar hook-length control protein n=1 Tax=Pseudodesulfovibrio sediminis TaxID=2810563 RepID=A0ABN6EWF3_9BACT|nr:flagellar hook-length control protein FliK [Pseudodesulfovibrio sediminis]BCS89394.1 flagellar hook-length control protein [Pseudodesulfovibrio sediminis]
MQNIPGIALEKATEQIQTVKIASVKESDQQMLFSELFSEHAASVEKELALAPVATKDKMLESTPQKFNEQPSVNAAGTETPVTEEQEVEQHRENARMTQDEFDEVKDDLKEYGMTDEEIAKIEEKVNSDEGLTWGQFVAEVAQKVAAMRSVELTDEQKANLTSFFGKFGFSDKESAKLISHLEKGNVSKVMSALQAKIDTMPQDQQLLLSKQEVEAFTAALTCSKEFATKVQELLGTNSMPKDLKEAFTLIRQELADMDKKDQKLAKAVGKAFVATMNEEHKQSSAARQVEEAIDLKPRVTAEEVKTDAKEELAQAVKTTKDNVAETAVRRNTEKNVTDKVDIKTDSDKQEPNAQDAKSENDENWNNLFGKMTDDGSQSAQAKTQTRTQAEALSKTGLTEAQAKVKTAAWEKVSAPKVMKQVDNAVLQTLKNGTKQLTLQLTPENLGKLSVILSVQGKEVGATIRAESHEAAKVIADNLDIIKNSLENQGLKVEKLEVQTGLSNNQNSNDWFGQNEHNLAREREAMVAMRNHMRQMRANSGGVLAQDVQSIREQAITADNGLHVIA